MKRKPDLLWVLVILFSLGVVGVPIAGGGLHALAAAPQNQPDYIG